MTDPERFLREAVLAETGKLYEPIAYIKVPAGVHKFDLLPGFNKLAELRLADANENPEEELIMAYWLPWQTRAVTQNRTW